jgi:polysaccharide deacetylase family protein (PEP-CTERM system associated)
MHAFTIDVEDWYHQIDTGCPQVRIDNWKNLEDRADWSTNILLDMLAESNVKATLFFLGYIAQKYPQLTTRAVSEGHEIASHGMHHQPLGELKPSSFFEDITRSKEIIENQSGAAVVGYRAPSFSLTEQTVWAYTELARAGYKYSSSVFSTKRAKGGWGDVSKPTVFYTPTGKILELPIPTGGGLYKLLPPVGGGYFRLCPLFYFRSFMKRNDKSIFYIHPRDLDKGQPLIPMSPFRRFRAYTGIGSCEDKLRIITNKYQWGRIDQIYAKKLAEITSPTATDSAHPDIAL